MSEEFDEKMKKLDNKVVLYDRLLAELMSKIAKLDAMLQESQELIVNTKKSNDNVMGSVLELQGEIEKLNNQFDELMEDDDEELTEDDDNDAFGLFTSSEWENLKG